MIFSAAILLLSSDSPTLSRQAYWPERSPDLRRTVEVATIIVYNYLASATKLREVAMAQPKNTKNNAKVSDKNTRRSATRSSGAKESEFVRVGKRVAHEHADTLRRLAKS